jgi:deoxyhypusine synthase
LGAIRTYPLSDRQSKVSTADFAGIWEKGASFRDFVERLPDILAGSDLKAAVDGLVKAARGGKTVIWGMGAHVIKVGLNPIVIDLMRRGVITGVAMNGAGIIHDVEVAMAGRTSEDVAASLADGSFGMARETADFLNEAVVESERNSTGLGQSVGRAIMNHQLPLMEHSILAAGYRLDIPVTVHIAIGTDIIHMHPRFDPAAAGKASHRDFRLLTSMVGSLENGVYLNVGSAVILPEIFLKAVTLARNLGHRLDHFMTVNIDFIRHYRPLTNVVQRPTAKGGIGINLVGHHEILVPLIAAGLIEALDTAT